MAKYLSKTKKKQQIQQSNSNVPQLVIDCIDVLQERGLEVEGILRVSGSNAKMRELRKDYEKGKQTSLEEIEVHTVGGLLKNYFRDLKEPIFPFCYYDTLLDVVKIEKKIQIEYIKSIISNLPESNQETLHWLIVFLNKVADKSNENKMDLSNLATMFGPNLIRNQKQTATQMLRDLPFVRSVMLVILVNYRYLFENWPDDQIKKPPSSLPTALRISGEVNVKMNESPKNVQIDPQNVNTNNNTNDRIDDDNNNNNNNNNNNVNNNEIDKNCDMEEVVVIRENKRKHLNRRWANRNISSPNIDGKIRHGSSDSVLDDSELNLSKTTRLNKKRSSSDFLTSQSDELNDSLFTKPTKCTRHNNNDSFLKLSDEDEV